MDASQRGGRRAAVRFETGLSIGSVEARVARRQRNAWRRAPSAFRRGALVVVGAMAWHGFALAAEAPADAEPDARIRIEVTGSRIARLDAETALPVQVITREEILRGNWANAREILGNLPANIGGENMQTSIGATSPGQESANLRGIGDGNTLVLLNGRRLSNYAFQNGAVNLGSIPVAALDRIEILKDGASSVYGSDAIAGVINFITRTDYSGLDVVGQAGITQSGGGDHYQATVTAGWGSLAKDRVNAFVVFDWQKDTALASIDRRYSATSYWPDEGVNGLLRTSAPANIRVNVNKYLNPAYSTGCTPPLSLPATSLGSTSGEMCLFDFAAVSKIVPDAERWTALARGAWQVTPDHQLFAEYLHARTQTTLEFTPTPISGTLNGQALLYPADGPYYPTDYAAANGLSGPLRLYYRTVELGPRTDVATTDAQRIIVGAQGIIGDWSYAGGYNYSQNTADDVYTKGWILWSRLRPAMGTGLINPWGPNTGAALDLLASTQYVGPARTATGTMSQADFQMSRDWFALPGGPAAVALGGEWRRESLSDRPEPFLESGDVVGAGFAVSPQDASRTVGALFAEVNLPLTKDIEVLASVRYDHYSDFGGTTNPKIGARWQPLKALLFRAAWGTGFRAPLLTDLYTQQQTLIAEPLNDPLRCPATQSPDDCTGSFNWVVGGNPNLQPETSTQETAGFIFEPAPGWSFGAQWWHIDKRNQIFMLNDPQYMLDHPDVFGVYVSRGPVDPAYPSIPGPVTTIVDINQNYGSLKTSGIDFSAQARMPLGSLGNLSLGFNGTYVYQFEEQLPGFDPASWVGVYGPYGPIPRWRHYGQLVWQYASWSTTLSQSFQSGVVDGRPDPEGNPRRVGTYSLWNLQGAYSGFANTSITLGVRNLFNTDPPFSNSARFNYIPNQTDPRGRTFYGRISYSFK
jgi:iron complex outermembrane receptor protein